MKYTYHYDRELDIAYFTDEDGGEIEQGDWRFDGIKKSCEVQQKVDYAMKCEEQTSELVPGKTYEI